MKAVVVKDQAAGTAGMKLAERPEPQLETRPAGCATLEDITKIPDTRAARPAVAATAKICFFKVFTPCFALSDSDLILRGWLEVTEARIGQFGLLDT